jgi:hypothetical protein
MYQILFLLILFSNVLMAQESSTLKIDDFKDNPPAFPKIILPGYEEDKENKNSFLLNEELEGYRIQVATSTSEESLISIRTNLEKLTNEKIYIIFELPNYKVRVGNYLNRKDAEVLLKKLSRNGYRYAWIVPTKIERNN